MPFALKYPTRHLAPRTTTRRTTEGTMASYVHPNGMIGVLVEVNCESKECARSVEFMLFAQWIAEQIAATAPLAVDRDQLDSELVARRYRQYVADALGDGGSLEAGDAAVAAIVDTRMEAFYRDTALMDQRWARNPALTIGSLTAQVSAMSGETIRIRRFSRFHMGMA
jgi:elongation factor Ts